MENYFALLQIRLTSLQSEIKNKILQIQVALRIYAY